MGISDMGHHWVPTVTPAMVCPVAGLISVKTVPALTQLPVTMEPLAGRPEANRSVPCTNICNPLSPGEFQLSVVTPTAVPAASVIGFGLAVNVTGPDADVV